MGCSDGDADWDFFTAWAWKREHLPPRLRFERPYKYYFDSPNGRHVTINQTKYEKEGFASTVWDSSIIMAEFFEHSPQLIQKSRLCDLSAGTGLVGIVAASLGAEVTATDLPGNLPLLKHNAKSNGVSINVQPHSWGSDVCNVGHDFDVLVACDVMYIPEAVRDLAASVRNLSSSTGMVFVAHGRNSGAEVAFLAEMSGWAVNRLSFDELHPKYRAPDVAVLCLTRSSSSV